MISFFVFSNLHVYYNIDISSNPEVNEKEQAGKKLMVISLLIKYYCISPSYIITHLIALTISYSMFSQTAIIVICSTIYICGQRFFLSTFHPWSKVSKVVVANAVGIGWLIVIAENIKNNGVIKAQIRFSLLLFNIS